jgi:hypothetical protein
MKMKSVYSNTFLSCALVTVFLAGCSSSETNTPEEGDGGVRPQPGESASPDAAGPQGSDAGPSQNTDAGAEPGDGPAADAAVDPSEPTDTDAGANPVDQADGGDEPNEPSVDAGGTGNEASQFFLPTTEPDNTAAPRIELDAAGGIHALYPAYAGGGAYYAYCAADCAASEDVKVVYLPTDGTVANAMLALTAEGKPRVLLSAYSEAIYASCDEDCTDDANWSAGVILDHGSDKEITGEALALDPDGHPHFSIHTYRALFGIGQLPPKTEYASCYAADCTQADAWEYAPLSNQIWEDAQLKFDAEGKAHLGFVADVMEDLVVTARISAYAECAGNCATEEDWPSIGLANAYANDTEVVSIKPSVSLALTSDGKPRLLAFAVSDTGEKNLDYFECDENCTTDGFLGSVLSNHPDVGTGIDLALDDQDRPRFVHTLDYNIVLAYCDDLPCAAPDAQWDLTMVEAGGNIPKDNIFLYPNCYVGAWFLHSPSLALTADGAPRVGYQARDISGGLGNPDGPNTPDCVAGTDMTWSRMSVMSSYRE